MNNQKHTILLVEDEPFTKKLVSHSLTTNGFVVIEADNGQEALEKCKQTLPDLIISDVMMPVLDGLELRKKLLHNDRLNAIPFIFLSARAQTHEVIRGEKMRPNIYITKPVEPGELIAAIKELLHIH